jgi:hypothetical protein
LNKTVRSRPRTVSSIFDNLERLVVELAPRSAQALLGVRWSFGLPGVRRDHLAEYSLPLSPTPFPELLETRSGLRIVIHHGDETPSLDDHLAAGRPAIVAVDSFYLPYRPAYGRVHSSRTIIVRPRRHNEEVHVEDMWAPCYEGPLPRAELERARRSSVPRDTKLEPIFSGKEIDGEWFSVELTPTPIADAAAWASGILRMLYEEATHPVVDDRGEFGIAALQTFCERLKPVLVAEPGEEGLARRQEASLLLRAELSSRVYLCAFLRAASGWIGDTFLRAEAGAYYDSLFHMEAARDALTKSLTHFRPEYSPYILALLKRMVESEDRLAAVLSIYA